MFAVDYMKSRASAGTRRDSIVKKVAGALHSPCGDATSIEAVLHFVAIPERDVADEFGDTADLIAAVVKSIAERMLAPLAERPTEASFRRQITEFACRATDEYSGMRLKNLYRIAVTDAIRSRRVQGTLYRHGPAAVQNGLARFFAAATSAGIRMDVDSRRLASYFLALMRTHWDLSDMAGTKHGEHVEDDIRQLVEAFFTGIQTESKDAVVVALQDQN